jgi:DNA mismatch repair ATPase MutS
VKELAKDLETVGDIISKTRSLDLGANIDDTNIREAVVKSINDFSYEKTDLIDKIKSSNADEYNRKSIAGELDIKNAGFLLVFRNEIYEDLEELLKKDLDKIEKLLGKYKEIVTSSILTYRNELCLYYGAIRLLLFVESKGFEMSFAKPGINLRTENVYSIHMLYEKAAGSTGKYEIVHNSINLNERERILLITGPNNGGKTVLAQTLGLAQLLFQNGLYSPMSGGTLPVYNRIYTHFPKDEDIGLGTGRLGEEAARVSKIYQIAENNSLVIFNEPYITTSPIEGLDILIKSLRKFMEMQCIVYLVTHYLDILQKSGESNDFASYVMEIKDERKTYKALRRPPLEKSYALELARKHKVDESGLIKLTGTQEGLN